jgi:hypothetical protein
MNQIISDDELAVLLQQAMSHAPEGLTTEQLELVLAWATEARLNAVLLERCLSGDCQVSLKNGEVSFSTPA